MGVVHYPLNVKSGVRREYEGNHGNVPFEVIINSSARKSIKGFSGKRGVIWKQTNGLWVGEKLENIICNLADFSRSVDEQGKDL